VLRALADSRLPAHRQRLRATLDLVPRDPATVARFFGGLI